MNTLTWYIHVAASRQIAAAHCQSPTFDHTDADHVRSYPKGTSHQHMSHIDAVCVALTQGPAEDNLVLAISLAEL